VYVEPHARNSRRAEASLSLSLDRLSGLRARARHSSDARNPGASGAARAREIVAFIQALRKEELFKAPGIAETLDWTSALTALGADKLDAGVVTDTLGVVLKYQDDIAKLDTGAASRACSNNRSTT
jgi:MoxR-like ATPase